MTTFSICGIIFLLEGNMLDDLLIPDDKRVTIDLHDMELLEAEYYLDKLFETLPEDIQEVVVIHGYRKGQVLLNMVRKDFCKRQEMLLNSADIKTL